MDMDGAIVSSKKLDETSLLLRHYNNIISTPQSTKKKILFSSARERERERVL